jgi:diaminohydroxyphosphoribosylaminopyrimidine deaminase/5-amino-6-(5-phosphoribosylamino)uracil reductase
MASINYMKEALKLASKGKGKTTPNPMVGVVIVRDGKIVSRAYHKKAGTPHAEVLALEKLTSLKRCILYVTLEPCCHWGRTPPCTQKIISSGIKEVHIAVKDPSPWVNGKGIKELQEAGIKVVMGECKEEAVNLNLPYFKWVKTGFPYVTLKVALSLDGKIATLGGESKWITTFASRKFVHKLRSKVDAIMVGIGTVIQDNPQLTVRLVKGRNPKVIVLDPNCRIPSHSFLLSTGCILAVSKGKEKKLPPPNILWSIRGESFLKEVLKRCGKEGIQHIMIEGGSFTFTQAIKEGVVDEVYFFIAPKIIGEGIPFVKDLGIQRLKESIRLREIKVRKISQDILVYGRVSDFHL